MISKNITKDSVIRAIDKINIEGVPKGRESTKYNIKYMGKLFPPKYTISLSNLFANGTELKPEDFSGGEETNNYLMKLGFEIISYGDMYNNNNKQSEKNKELDDNVCIATVTIQSSKQKQASNKDRTKLLENVIKQAGNYADIMILPAGFYNSDDEPDSLYSEIEYNVEENLNMGKFNSIICLGVDGRNGVDQVGLAINNQEIISIARKFYPTDGEVNFIQAAADYMSTEDGYSRIIDVKGKKFYLAICYDGYGLRKQNIKNPGVNGILNLVHKFYPQGHGESGDVYFAKYSFAGSSKQWECPTFGTAIFYGRDIPEKWPTGVLWNQRDKNVQEWKYTDNAISPIKQMETSWKNEKAVIKIYSLV